MMNKGVEKKREKKRSTFNSESPAERGEQAVQLEELTRS